VDSTLKAHIENELGREVTSSVPVSGGDIASTYKVRIGEKFWFCKFQEGKLGFDMLQREKEGLAAIQNSGHIRTPQILLLSDTGKGGLLLLEYIDSRPPSDDEMGLFGEKLAGLHAETARDFGWKTGNYIGSLPQSNDHRDSWKAFYTSQRLMPQLSMARNKGLLTAGEIPKSDQIELQVERRFRPARPCLVHGDLWRGNYLITHDGEPCLIDPSVSYAHPGMDLAMSRLFGGFSPAFYEGYSQGSPLPLQDQAETDLGQLYYLLVHLNLFGSSYVSSVRAILGRYF
jgi:fructosamine-3-kinase